MRFSLPDNLRNRVRFVVIALVAALVGWAMTEFLDADWIGFVAVAFVALILDRTFPRFDMPFFRLF